MSKKFSSCCYASTEIIKVKIWDRQTGRVTNFFRLEWFILTQTFAHDVHFKFEYFGHRIMKIKIQAPYAYVNNHVYNNNYFMWILYVSMFRLSHDRCIRPFKTEKWSGSIFNPTLYWQISWHSNIAKDKTKKMVPLLARLAHGYPQGWI